MEPRIAKREAFSILGIGARIKPMEADYSAIWRGQYDPRHAEISAVSTGEACYGVYFQCGEPDFVDFVAGMVVPHDTAVLDGLVLREVPAADLEAEFDCRLDGIGATWGAIFQTWLPGSGYECAEDLSCFEEFPPSAGAPDSPVVIHVPLRAAR
jgi:predicted transcriptional regulator YdeE